MSMPDRPWVPDTLPERVDLTDTDIAETDLDTLHVTVDEMDLTEIAQVLDYLGHADHAQRLYAAKDALAQAIKQAEEAITKGTDQ